MAVSAVGLTSGDFVEASIQHAIDQRCSFADIYCASAVRTVFGETDLFFRGAPWLLGKWLVVPVAALLLCAAFWRDLLALAKGAINRYASWVKNG